MLWGVTSFFNPVGYARPLHNIQTFAARVRAQGLPLMIVELAFGDADFEIDDSLSDIVVRLRFNDVMWHKEALINVGLRHLPADCDAVAWLDSDLLFENQEWVADTRTALEQHRVVQPFSQCIWLPPDVESVDIALTTYPTHAKEYARIHSFGFGWHHFGPHALEARVLYGHLGFAWAARRDLLDVIGLYDSSIVGPGDSLMVHAFVGREAMLRTDGRHMPAGLLAHYGEWADRAYAAVQGDVSYVDGTVNHLWHGRMSNRGYDERHRILLDAGFDPRVHLERDENGLHRLRNVTPQFAEALRQLFLSRKEDEPADATAVCVFGSGFYDDEGAFRWAAQHATARVSRQAEDWSITVSNNAPHRLAGPQSVTASVNGVVVAVAELPDNNKVDMMIGSVAPGDEIRLQAEHTFRPSRFGGNDNRDLSFILWNS